MVLKADKHTPVYVIAVLVLHHTPSVVGPQHALGCATNVADGDIAFLMEVNGYR